MFSVAYKTEFCVAYKNLGRPAGFFYYYSDNNIYRQREICIFFELLTQLAIKWPTMAGATLAQPQAPQLLRAAVLRIFCSNAAQMGTQGPHPWHVLDLYRLRCC